jgi:sialidase-1
MKKTWFRWILLCLFSFFFSSIANAAGKNAELYATSFEDFSREVEKLDGDVAWKAIGKAEITDRVYHTGSKSLRLFGGTANTVELVLSGAAKRSKWIRFQAERWSSKTPFEFRIQAKVDGEWIEVANLDKRVAVGAKFTSDVVVKLPKGRITGLRLICTALENTGVLIDEFYLLKEEPTSVMKALTLPKVATEPIKRFINNEALFVSGTLDTHTFRIPAIITAQNGDLIAVCDARREHRGDLHLAQDIDIVIRRSSNNGRTWTKMDIVCDFGDGLPASDPSLILDESTGEIFCFYNYMDQNDAPKEYRLYVQSSKDHGKTWGEARDISDDITPPSWKRLSKFVTSGRGIQTRDGELLHTLVRGGGIHIFGSRNHGKRWYRKTDNSISPANESKIIELTDGRLMVNCRASLGEDCRWVHISEDGGKSWEGRAERSLVDPGCNGAILRYTSVEDGYEKNRLLFCNANAPDHRKNLAIRISYDEGKTWSDGKVINHGNSAYSELTICEDGTIGILWEPSDGVRFTSITLEDLTDGKDKLSKPYKIPGTGK